MKHLIFLSTVLFLSPPASQAQWKPDVRLTNDPADSYTSPFNNGWCIASSGDVVHVVWYDSRDGNNEIYYKRSTDAGVSWGGGQGNVKASRYQEIPLQLLTDAADVANAEDEGSWNGTHAVRGLGDRLVLDLAYRVTRRGIEVLSISLKLTDGGS